MFDLKKFSGNKAIITDKGFSIEYSQLNKDANQVASQIDDHKFVFCLCSNTIGSVVGYVGCLNNGKPALLLDSELNQDSLNEILKSYRPEYIWAPKERKLNYESEVILDSWNYSLHKLVYPDFSQRIEINKDLALCLTTSGSTGSPKLVRLSEKNLLSNAVSIAEYLDIKETDRPITSLPMHYSFGMSVINSHLIKGATILMTDKSIMQKEFWDFMKNEKATSMSGVPYTYEMLRRLRFFRMDLPNLKVMTQAGGKLNETIVKEYADFALENGKDFFVMYGQTEASPRISYMTTQEAVIHPSSIGKPVPGGNMWVQDSEGNKITEPNVNGELIYEGPNVCLGYAESIEDLKKGDENQGILHTGDIANFDSEGFFYITGRMKRFVKVWGNRCNLDAVEQIIREMKIEAGVIGRDNNIIIIVTDPEVKTLVMDKIIERTGFHPSAFKIVVKDSLPYAKSGKIVYSELEKELL